MFDPATNNVVASTVDLGEHGWTGEQHPNSEPTAMKVSPPPRQLLVRYPELAGGANISHTFTDFDRCGEQQTAVLSFDIGTQSDRIATASTTRPIRLRRSSSGSTARPWRRTTRPDFKAPDQLQHFDIDISSYAGFGDTHTLTLVDTTANAGYAGFAIDSVKIHDWII